MRTNALFAFSPRSNAEIRNCATDMELDSFQTIEAGLKVLNFVRLAVTKSLVEFGTVRDAIGHIKPIL